MGELAVSRAFGDAEFKKGIQVPPTAVLLIFVLSSCILTRQYTFACFQRKYPPCSNHVHFSALSLTHLTALQIH